MWGQYYVSIFTVAKFTSFRIHQFTNNMFILVCSLFTQLQSSYVKMYTVWPFKN